MILHLLNAVKDVSSKPFVAHSSVVWDCSKSGGFALIASEKRLDRGLYGVVSLSAW
jgi:hypothetical protein